MANRLQVLSMVELNDSGILEDNVDTRELIRKRHVAQSYTARSGNSNKRDKQSRVDHERRTGQVSGTFELVNEVRRVQIFRQDPLTVLGWDSFNLIQGLAEVLIWGELLSIFNLDGVRKLVLRLAVIWVAR
ncbi:hypothetical protein Dda_7003 [Drechslerella dactyloides]|uniref:Uncharacterized protein n=1 Tax=Drechslerella dactyloides TaxID=74499 RepID=A0AAD6IT73_DREDA|nr:hypothetical protein Dda_7003 [Drechslerella dactyloides]